MRESLEVLAYDDLRTVLEGWPAVLASRAAGGSLRRPLSVPHVSLRPGGRVFERDRAERARDRAELQAYALQAGRPAPDAPGASLAPVDVGVLDTIVLVTETVWECREYVREQLAAVVDACAVPSQPAHRDQLVPMAARWLQTHLDALRPLDLILEHVAGEAHVAARLVRTALGDEPRTVQLTKIGCPVCDLRQLEVEVDADPPLLRCAANRPPGQALCVCSDPHCGCRRGDPHTWPAPVWPRLRLPLDRALQEALR